MTFFMHNKRPEPCQPGGPSEGVLGILKYRKEKPLPPGPTPPQLPMPSGKEKQRELDFLRMSPLIERIKQSKMQTDYLREISNTLKKELNEARKGKEEAEENNKASQAELYEMTKNIRVTDDDFSTIIAKFGKFFGKLSNFPPNSKSTFKKELTNTELAKFFIENIKDIDDREKEVMEALFKLEETLDYSLVSVLVEKLIVAEIADDIFDAPIHLNPKLNEAYLRIKDLLDGSNQEAKSKEYRLKLSRATLDAMNNFPAADKIYSERRGAFVDTIVTKLALIYNQPDEIKTRIERLVDMAIELSLPIRGQDDLLKIYKLYPGAEVISNQVRPIYRHLDMDSIYLGITPVFLAKSVSDENYNEEEEEEGEEVPNGSYIEDHTLVYQGKAIW
ncbi:unnamed protein product [Mucor hiemalis]